MRQKYLVWATALFRFLRKGEISSYVGGMFVSGIYVDGQHGKINPAIRVIRGYSLSDRNVLW